MSARSSATSRLRSGLKRLTALAWALLAMSIIVLAVVVGLGRLLIPYADHARPWLEQALSEQLEQPVTIARVEAHWPRLTPRLDLHDVHVGPSAEPLLDIGMARLEVHLPNLLDGERHLINLIVLGLDLVLRQDEDGQWDFQLEGGAQIAREDAMDRLPPLDLRLRDARVRLAPANFPETVWLVPDGGLQRDGNRTQLFGQLRLAASPDTSLRIGLLATDRDGLLNEIGLQLEGEDLPLGQWMAFLPLPFDNQLASLALTMDLRARWHQVHGGDLRLDFGLSGWPGVESRDRIEGVLLGDRRERQTRLSLKDLIIVGSETRLIFTELAVGEAGNRRALGLEALDLGRLHGLLDPLLSEHDWWPSQAAGQIPDLELAVDSALTPRRLQGRIERLAIAPVLRAPGVQDLDINLGLAGDRVEIGITGPFTLDWPTMVRETVVLENTDIRALLSPSGVEIDRARIDHVFTSASADGWIHFTRPRPFLDFAIDVHRVGPGDPRPWLLSGIIPEGAMAWLDQAMVSIGPTTGGLVFHMPAGRRARDINPGDFGAWADFTEATLAYWPGWPEGEEIAGRVEFLGRSVDGRIDHGLIGGLPIATGRVRFDDLVEPVLEMKLGSKGAPADQLINALSALPLDEPPGGLDLLAWQGELDLAFDLDLPLRAADQWQLAGQLEFADTELTIVPLARRLDDLTGSLAFERGRLQGSQLRAQVDGLPVAFGLDANSDPEPTLQLDLRSAPQALLPKAWADGAEDLISGRTDWQINLTRDPAGGLGINVGSDLRGVLAGLPAPLDKAADEAWPLALELRLADHERRLVASLADRIRIVGLEQADRRALAVALGDHQTELPGQGWRVDGRLPVLDLGGWLELDLPMTGAGQQLAEGGGKLEIGQLQVGGAELHQTRVEVTRGAEDWRVELAGRDVNGLLAIPVDPGGGRLLTADFERLSLHPGPTAEVGEVLETHWAAPQTSAADPALLPPLHVLIEDLRWDGLALGRARLETHPTIDGLEAELIEITGEGTRLQGSGRWVNTPDGPRCQFDLRLTTDRLGELLASANYETGLVAGSSRIEISAAWPGAPTDFALARVDGELEMQLNDGLIPEARPGAGRLIGLVSLNAIPRRLMLDFRDVFEAGLKFDEISGKFRLGAGLATTEAVVIDAPAARITIRGTTDLVGRQYDQTVLVEPVLGATLPVLGILAGGAAGAAAGLLLRTLLDRPLRGISEARYQITGSWEEPIVELVQARVADEDGEEQVIGEAP